MIWAVSASGSLDPIRISIATGVETTGKPLTISILQSSGLAFETPKNITFNSGGNVPTDYNGVISFVLNSTTAPAWTSCDYNANYLVRVTYGTTVILIERMEVIIAKQALFGAMIDPPEISPSLTNGDVLTTTAGTVAWAAPATNGTVTNTSVVSANGFSGSVATQTTTPAITISTSITGMLKGGATAISAAMSGTDYSAGTSALGTGILKSTTTTGALSIAVAGTDYLTPTGNGSGLTSLTGANVSGNISGSASGLTAQYIDWTSSSGGNSIANKPDLTLLAPKASPTFTGTVTLNGATSGTVGILAAGTTTPYTLTLPPSAGTTGQVLTAGATPSDLSWKTPCGQIYAYCYDKVGGTQSANTDIVLSSNGPMSGITHTISTTGITVPDAGIYKIDYGINVINNIGAALVITVNDVVDESTRIHFVSAIHNYHGTAILSLAAGAVIKLRNASAVDIDRPVPGVNTQISIIKLN